LDCARCVYEQEKKKVYNGKAGGGVGMGISSFCAVIQEKSLLNLN
jgi:hypothetical protein